MWIMKENDVTLKDKACADVFFVNDVRNEWDENYIYVFIYFEETVICHVFSLNSRQSI